MVRPKSTRRQGTSRLIRETMEMVAMLRQLQEKMALAEEHEPDSPLLRGIDKRDWWQAIEGKRVG
jgi:hypothetical protein